MRPCIECGTPTEGSIGQAGMKWAMLCQPCKDKADAELAQSIAKMAAAIDYALPRCFPAMNALEDIALECERDIENVDGQTVLRLANEAITKAQQQPSPSTPEAA